MLHAATPKKSLATLVAVSALLLVLVPSSANAAPPANDAFAQPADFSWPDFGPASITQNTSEATMEAGEPTPPCGSGTLGRSVWFRWRPSSDLPVQIDTVGSNFDTVIGVYTGSALDSLNEVACNDDQAGRSNSVVTFSAVKLTQYFIQVGGYGGAGGDLTVSVGPPQSGSIAGRVRSDATGPLRGTCVDAFIAEDPTGSRAYTNTTSTGTYVITGLISGAYQVRFYDCDNRFDHLDEWYADKDTQAEADEVVVTSPATTAGIDAELTALRLRVLKTGSGVGTITSQPAGIDCGDDCEEIYTHGDFPTEVTLTADAGAGSLFAGWTGCGSAVELTCTVTMDQARQVGAAFNLRRNLLSVQTAGRGNGVVTTTGIDCGAGTSNDCSEEYDHGKEVMLTAAPGENSLLGGFTGCDDVEGSECTVTMAGARDVGVTFDLVSRDLTVARAGAGNGTVTGTGIDCGPSTSDCSDSYEHGTVVTLAATPEANSELAGWDGCDIQNGAECTVEMTSARAVTASFEPEGTSPETTIVEAPAPATNETSASFTFTSSKLGSTFSCSLDGAAFAACASPASYSALSEGSHTFRVRARDAVGNVDETPAEHAWIVDVTAPDTTLTSTPSDPSAESASTFTFESDEPGVTFSCSLAGAAFSPCTSPASYGLAEGTHTFEVRASDAAGNIDESPAVATWRIDRTPPDTIVQGGPGGRVSSPQATFTFGSTEPGTFACSIDGDPFASCKSPRTYAGLAEGSHTFRVRATDQAGNIDPSPATRDWVIDFGSPTTTITSGPAGITTETGATFEFESSETPSTIYCKLDGGVLMSCTSPKTYTGLVEGPHTFTVFSVDAAGNEGPPTKRLWTVDSAGPVLTVDRPTGGLFVNDQAVGSGPVNVVVGSVKVRVRAVDDESGVSSFTFEVGGTAVDPAQVTKQGNLYEFTFRPPAPGQHTITAKATNGSGLTTTQSIQVIGVPTP